MLRRLLAVVLVAGIVAGCSGARVVYNQLDVLLPWYFRDYVDLDTGQRQQLERSADMLLTWHRESQVARYAAFFRELERDAADPLGYQRIEAGRLELEVFWDDIVRQVTPEAAQLLRMLDEPQVEEMFRRIAEKDAERAREALGRSDGQRLARREKTLRRQIQRWVGGLDEQQRGLVSSASRDLSGDVDGWLASRRSWQAAFRAAMELRHDPGRFEPLFEKLFAEGESFWEDDYRRHFLADRARIMRLMADVDASLSEEQRRHLRRRLGRWAQDLEAIAGGG